MGAQKKFSHWRFGITSLLLSFACFLMATGFCVIDLVQTSIPTARLLPQSNDVYYWKDVGTLDTENNHNKIYSINNISDLAGMSKCITEAGASELGEDYTGWTFELEQDFNLGSMGLENSLEDGTHPVIEPLWTPIDIGKLGKNKNISFNGKGHTISGMRIVYDTDTACNAGFFANMIGGVFENVTFLNPIIEYNYTGPSIPKLANPEDPTSFNERSSLPTDICIGVIAGAADSTYINNVNIINPTISFTSNNNNAHNFCVGTAVGKLSFTTEFDENDEVASINTVSPKKWGIDTVIVKKDGDTTPAVTMNIQPGSEVAYDAQTPDVKRVTYGEATYAYFGGLVGVNISSKVINSTLRGIRLAPDIGAAAGTFYIGGIAGLTTQIATASLPNPNPKNLLKSDLVVAAGLYNNLLRDVVLVNVTNTNNDTRYCGNLVGRIYGGSWVYNNLLFIDNDLPLWENVLNDRIYVYESAHVDDCIGSVLGAADDYYFNNNNYVGNTGCSLLTQDGYISCGEHRSSFVQLKMNLDNQSETHYGSSSVMSQYNFQFKTLSDADDFLHKPFDGDLSQFDLMSNFDRNRGYLYYASLPIQKFETGLTVNKIDPATGEVPTDEEKVLEAVLQFRPWNKDNGEPNLTPGVDGYIGQDCSITFYANSPTNLDPHKNSEAYFTETVVDENGSERQTKVSEKVLPRSYQQLIYAPEKPECEGYTFKGWVIQGTENKPENIHNFEIPDRVNHPGLCFDAVWQINTYTVTYMYYSRDEDGDLIPGDVIGTEPVEYGGIVTGCLPPTSNNGCDFVGWFTDDNLPEDGYDAVESKRWILGSTGDRMPSRNLSLYAGWKDNFGMLRSMLDGAEAIADNLSEYFADNDALREFEIAYNNAKDAITNNDPSNATALLNSIKNCIEGLRVDPRKILNTKAFDDTQIENLFPFLYDYDTYVQYTSIKEIIQNYAMREDEETTKDIGTYISYYENLNDFFNSLKNNLRTSVSSEGGISSTKIQNLIQKYQNLEKQYGELNFAEYEEQGLETLEAIEVSTKSKFTELKESITLDDLAAAVSNYEAALNNLKPKKVEEETTPNKSKVKNVQQLGISPISLSIIIVSVLASGACGYIGIDLMVNKHRMKILKAKNIKTSNNKMESQQSETSDSDDNYV